MSQLLIGRESNDDLNTTWSLSSCGAVASQIVLRRRRIVSDLNEFLNPIFCVIDEAVCNVERSPQFVISLVRVAGAVVANSIFSSSLNASRSMWRVFERL